MAVIGCGYWGPNLIRNISENPNATLSWIVDTNQAALDTMGNRFPRARQTTRLEEALADPSLQAVAIATPVATHFLLAAQCLTAGKHVLVEKPMAQSVDQCQKLIELAGSTKRVLMVDHTFVYTAAVKKMRELVSAGELGEVYYFDSVRVNLGLLQKDSNVIWDLAPHDLSIMDYVLGKRPVRIAVHAARHVADYRWENMAYLTLRFEDETLAHFHVNWLAPAKIRRIIVGGSKKMLVYDDLSPDEKIKIYDKGLLIKEGPRADAHKAMAGYRSGDLLVPHLDNTEALQTEIRHFLDCLQSGQEPLTNGEAGLRVVRILAAAERSLVHGGSFVDI